MKAGRTTKKMPEEPEKKRMEHPRSFRFDDKMKEDITACAEMSRSTDTEVMRQALRLYRRKLERESS